MIWPFVWKLVVTLVISYATQPKQQRPKPAAFDDFEFPTADEGTPQCVVFGDCWSEDWFVNGLGNYRQRAIKKGGGLFSSSQTIGYNYYFGIHMGICRGPINEIVEIKVADRAVWAYSPTAPVGPSEASLAALQEWRDSGSYPPIPTAAVPALNYEKVDQTEWRYQIDGSKTIQIKAANVFGGESGEGGVAGRLDVMMGEATQSVNPRLQAMVDDITPAYRGKLTCFFDGLVCSISPYPKPWKFRLRRSTAGWEDNTPWYPEKALILLDGGAIHAQNPAHIIYEACTNMEWGRGLPRALLGSTWTAAADTLYAEGMGCCIRWTRQAGVTEFIDEIVNQIGANFYMDPTTGLFELKLIRDDYLIDDLPLFTFDSGLLGVEEDESSATVVSANTVIVNYRDPITNTDGSVRVDNLAAIQGAGAVQPQTLNFTGVPTPQLAARIAQRELRSRNTGIKRMTVRLDRRAKGLIPGSVFRVSVPDLGISEIVLRAGSVSTNGLTSGELRVEAVQDMFGLPLTSYVKIQPPGWSPPTVQPTVISARKVFELSHQELAAAGLLPVADSAGLVSAVAAKPTALSLNYVMQSRAYDEDFADRGIYDFCPTAILDADMPVTNSPLIVPLTSESDLESVLPGTAAYCGEEILRVIGIDLGGRTVTLARGCADTVPAFHAAGSRLWFYASGEYAGLDTTHYEDETEVDVRLIPQSSGGVLNESLAVVDTIEMSRRQLRPYPPGAFEINGEEYPQNVRGTLEISFAYRNRIAQGAQLIDASAASIPPEDNTQYTITARRTDTNAVVASANPANSPQLFDPGYTGEISISIETTRSGVTSLQSPTHVMDFLATGYGRAYGLSYGGTRTPGVVLPRPPEPYAVWSFEEGWVYIESLPGYIDDAKWLVSDNNLATSNATLPGGPGPVWDADLLTDFTGSTRTSRRITGADYTASPAESFAPPAGSGWTFLYRIDDRYYWLYESTAGSQLEKIKSRSTWYTDGTNGFTPVLVYRATELEGYGHYSGRANRLAQHPTQLFGSSGGMSDEPIEVRPPDRPSKIHVIDIADYSKTTYDVSSLADVRGSSAGVQYAHPAGGYLIQKIEPDGIFTRSRTYFTADLINFEPCVQMVNGSWSHFNVDGVGSGLYGARFSCGKWWRAYKYSDDGVHWQNIPDIAGQGSAYTGSMNVIDADDDAVVIKIDGTLISVPVGPGEFEYQYITRTQYWITTDGTTFTELNLPELPTPAPNAPDLPNAPQLFPYPGRLIAFKYGWLLMFPKTVLYPSPLIPGISIFYTDNLTANPTWLPLE